MVCLYLYNIDLVDSYATPLKTKYILIKKWLETYFPIEMVIFTGDLLIFGVYKCRQTMVENIRETIRTNVASFELCFFLTLLA